MKVIGLTGGIATGKSSVARLLSERHHIPVLDADEVARQVVAPGTPGLQALIDAFGEDILEPGGSLDRRKLRRHVMSDAAARQHLESITHPRIRQAITDQLAAWAVEGVPLAVVEAALLVETGSWRLYDRLVVVSCSPETQIARVVARDGGSPEEAQAILDAQLPLARKTAVAHHVIHNDGDIDHLAAAVSRLVQTWNQDWGLSHPSSAR